LKSVEEAERAVLELVLPWHSAHANTNTTRRSMVEAEAKLVWAAAELKAAMAKADAERKAAMKAAADLATQSST
jgi:hypothetical protein